MGSFNVGCGISNIAIEPGDKIGFVILDTGSGPDRIDPEVGMTTLLNEYDLYRPFLPPVFGVYDDYGSIEDIQPSKTTEFLEKYFEQDIGTVIECLTDIRTPYYDGGAIFRAYFKGSKKFTEFQASPAEGLLPLGFSKAKGKSNEEVYTLQSFEVVITGKEPLPFWSVRNAKTGEVLVKPFQSQFMHQVLDAFGNATGIYPGYDTADYSRILRLRNSSGMFFSEQVFASMCDYLATDGGFYEESHKRRKKMWDDFLEEPKMFERLLSSVAEGTKLAGMFGVKEQRQYSQIGRFVETNTSFPITDVWMLDNYGTGYEYLQLIELMDIMRVTNKLFTPSFCGSQEGDTKASLALHGITGAILDARLEQEKEWRGED